MAAIEIIFFFFSMDHLWSVVDAVNLYNCRHCYYDDQDNFVHPSETHCARVSILSQSVLTPSTFMSIHVPGHLLDSSRAVMHIHGFKSQK